MLVDSTDSSHPAGATARAPRPRLGPTLTLVIPATDSPATLGACLEHVRAAEHPPEEVRVVDLPARSGPAAARNRGAWEATGEILVFVDADVCVHRDAFTRLRARFAADPALAAVFGSYDASPAAGGLVSSFRNLLHHHVHQSGHGPAVTFWAGLGAVRRSAFEELGGFDAERCPRYVEDVELGMRLAASGARIELDGRIQGTHLKSWSLASMIRTDVSGRALPWLSLLLERRRLPATLNLAWRHRLGALASVGVLLALVARRPRPAGAAALALVALNLDFYRLLLRRRGPAETLAGVGLHALHHVSVALVLPMALARRGWGPRRRPAPGPAPRDLAHANPATTAQMRRRRLEADRDGGARVIRRTWRALDDVAPALAEAVVAAEDSEFHAHHGVDWSQAWRAMRQNLRERRLAASASTMTMQLAKNLYLSGEPTVRRKLKEAWLARRLEAHASKPRLLELYLNLIEWGPPGVFGAEEAARHHLGSSAGELGLEQAVELASIIPICPAGFDPAKGRDRVRDLREVIEAKPLLRGRRCRIEHALFHGQGRGGARRLRDAVERFAEPGRGSAETSGAGPPAAVATIRGVDGAAVLSLDGGPDPRLTPVILESLGEHRLRATFFLDPERVLAHPGWARAISEHGHEIGVREPGSGVGAEGRVSAAIVEEAAGFNPGFVRESAQRLPSHPRRQALIAVHWSADCGDPREHGPERAAALAGERLEPGAVLRLDCSATPAGEDAEDAIAGAIALIAAEARKRDLRLVSLGECLALARDEMRAQAPAVPAAALAR